MPVCGRARAVAVVRSCGESRSLHELKGKWLVRTGEGLAVELLLVLGEEVLGHLLHEHGVVALEGLVDVVVVAQVAEAVVGRIALPAARLTAHLKGHCASASLPQSALEPTSGVGGGERGWEERRTVGVPAGGGLDAGGERVELTDGLGVVAVRI